MGIKDLLFPKSKKPTPPDSGGDVQPKTGSRQKTANQPTTGGGQTVAPGQKIDTGPSRQVPKPKRKFPLKLMAIPIVIIIFTLIAGAVFKMVGDRPTECGTPGEIVWWGKMDERVVEPLIEQYLSENEGVSIKYVRQSPTDYRVRLVSSLENCEGPDIFEFHNSWVPMFEERLSVVPQNIISNTEYQSYFYPVVAESMKKGNGFVGIPLEMDMMVLYINNDIFASAALETPDTWNKFFDVSKRLTQNPENEIILSGAAMGITENVDNWQEIIGLLMKQNNVGVNNLESAKMASVIDFYKSFVVKDPTWDNTLADSTLSFANGKLAMLLAPLYRNDEIIEVSPSLNYYTTKVPQVPSDDPNAPDESYATFWVQGVWSSSVNKEQAWKFLEFLSGVEQLERMNNNRREVGITEKLYPRPEMAVLQRTDPFFLPAVDMAPHLSYWYLYDETHDGEEGVNSKIGRKFKNLIRESRGGKSKSFLKNFNTELSPVLTSYGIIR